MTPKQRILGALRGELVDQVPLCTYPNHVPQGETERKLRNEGMGIFKRVGVVAESHPDCTIESITYTEKGRRYIRNTLKTPVGEVYEVLRTGGGYGSNLRCEFFIKQPADYRVMQFYVKQTRYKPNYDAFRRAEELLGEDGPVIGNLSYTPLQKMLIHWMGPERFAIDFFEHPDEFFSLYELLRDKHREMYAIAAESPAEFIIYGDNITSEMVGLERFEKYVVPCYDECAEALHANGKKLGSHMDGNLKLLKDAIARSKLDFIEAYNPPPDGDLPISEARRCWGRKAISINFTSSIHLASDEEIERHTIELLREAYPGTGFVIGVTENIPEHVCLRSLSVINRTLREHGRLPLSL